MAGWGAGGSEPVCWKPPGSTSAAPPARPLLTLHLAASSSGSDPLQKRWVRQCALCSKWFPSGNSAQRGLDEQGSGRDQVWKFKTKSCQKQQLRVSGTGPWGNNWGRSSKIILYNKCNIWYCFLSFGQKRENKRWLGWAGFFHVWECAVSLWAHIELLYLVMDVALWEMFHVGELQVQFSQPHQHVLSGALKLLPLAGEVLRDRRRQTWMHYLHININTEQRELQIRKSCKTHKTSNY